MTAHRQSAKTVQSIVRRTVAKLDESEISGLTKPKPRLLRDRILHQLSYFPPCQSHQATSRRRSRTYVLLLTPITCTLPYPATARCISSRRQLHYEPRRSVWGIHPAQRRKRVQRQFFTPTPVVAIMKANPPLLQRRPSDFFQPTSTHIER